MDRQRSIPCRELNTSFFHSKGPGDTFPQMRDGIPFWRLCSKIYIEAVVLRIRIVIFWASESRFWFWNILWFCYNIWCFIRISFRHKNVFHKILFCHDALYLLFSYGTLLFFTDTQKESSSRKIRENLLKNNYLIRNLISAIFNLYTRGI